MVALVTDPIRILPDGTIKQINPFSGTQVWTVPGRGHRPIEPAGDGVLRVESETPGHHCPFCEKRYLDTPPEKSRLVRTGSGWERLDRLPAHELSDTVAEFRRVPNLFEILSLDYWVDNHGHQTSLPVRQRMADYLADPAGRGHALAVAERKARAFGITQDRWRVMSDERRLDFVDNFFDGGHDVIIARRHFADGTDTLAGSGTLTTEEHARFVEFTIWSLRELYDFNPNVKYVGVFQNWLRPAGASFDHLHKQLVAIDEYGERAEQEAEKVRTSPNLYNEQAIDRAVSHGLLLAENDHAVAFAGFGHRYPTLEVYSKSPTTAPWEQSAEEVRAVSDLLHACHAATGEEVPTNEEWYHQPPDLGVRMPWRVLIKWRVSTLAGFEGGTKINVNTISPFALRNQVLPALVRLRAAGAIAPMRLGAECGDALGRLRYLGG